MVVHYMPVQNSVAGWLSLGCAWLSVQNSVASWLYMVVHYMPVAGCAWLVTSKCG